MEKLFDIHVHITGFNQVKSVKGTVNCINFDGFCEAPFFNGKIVEGGVDTQKFIEGKTGTLSARYIVKGTDKKGKETSLFIENNGTFAEDGTISTTPWIITDNEELQPLFEGKLSGKVVTVDCPEHDKVLIEIYKE